jgi:hypothetical protein
LPSGGDVHVLDKFKPSVAAAIAKAKTISEVKRSPDAETLWRSVYPSLKTSRPGSWGKATERGRPLVVRLSLLYALLDGSPVIERKHLTAALAVWRYCEESARQLFGDTQASEIDFRIRRIVGKRPGIYRSELRKQFSHDAKTGEAFDAALRSLVARHEIVIVPVYENRQADALYPGVFDNMTTAENMTPEPPSEIFDMMAKANGAFSFSIDDPQPPTTTKSMTIGELVDWKNRNGIRFKREASGRVWVTPEYDPLLSPAIASAIGANQDIVSCFVIDPKKEIIPMDEFIAQLRAM